MSTDTPPAPDLVIGTTLEAAHLAALELGLDPATSSCTLTDVPDRALELTPGFTYRFVGTPPTHAGIAYSWALEALDEKAARPA